MNQAKSDGGTVRTRRKWRAAFLGIAFLIYVILAVSYLATRQNAALRAAIGRVEATTQLQSEVTRALVERIESDIPALVGLPIVRSFLREPADAALFDQAASAFSTFISAKGIYDQARIIDTAGHEILRVNKNEGGTTVVEDHHLQDKSDRYYVHEGMEAEPGSWYVSAFDLNVENGVIELPRKPMIRLVAPVEIDGSAAGLVLLNLLGDVILESYRGATAEKPGVVGLADENGWWLYVNDPEREWGNMYPDETMGSVADLVGSRWSEIRDAEAATIVLPDRVVSTQRITPFHGAVESADVGVWFVINHPSKRELGVDLLSVFSESVPLLIVSLTCFLVGAWLLANATHDRNRYRARIERAAFVDEVTETPNRRYLMNQLEREIDILRRYGRHFSILFLDLDGFKMVNDTIGHEAGDKVLREVARRLVASVRKSDTVARLGGDEFVLILVETTTREPVHQVAQKVLETIQRPIRLASGDARIGTSIGIAWTGATELTSGHDGAAEYLLKTADQAMYRAKHAGKNRIEWATV